MQEEQDKIYMRRCLDLALKAEGLTYPNPMVGAVIVSDGTIIGEGYHLASGKPHAEVNAIDSVLDRKLLGKSVLYVSLEPCSHFGKTPPCTDLIISSGIPRVVVGTADTSEKVNGRGIRVLREKGISVTEGVLEDECRRLNRRFFTFHEKQRPYITLKWACSADGFLDIDRPASSSPEPYWITGKTERVLVHKWRAEEEAILVGGETARKDRPKLNVRYWKGPDPLKVILSRTGDLGDYLLKNETKTLIFTFNKRCTPLRNAEWVVLKGGDDPVDKMCEVLYKMGKSSVFVEGGAAVLELFIGRGLWDEARIFTGRQFFGSGIKAPSLTGYMENEFDFGKSTLNLVLNHGAPGEECL